MCAAKSTRSVYNDGPTNNKNHHHQHPHFEMGIGGRGGGLLQSSFAMGKRGNWLSRMGDGEAGCDASVL